MRVTTSSLSALFAGVALLGAEGATAAAAAAAAYVPPSAAASRSPLFGRRSSSSVASSSSSSAAAAAAPTTTTRLDVASISDPSASSSSPSSSSSPDAPPLRRTRPRKLCLMVEPSPFTHVCGYSNRFNEMLRYLSKAGDTVDVLTTECHTPPDELPTEKFGYDVHHTQGFSWFLYPSVSVSFDLPEMKGLRILERVKPDLIHVTSPGVMLIAALFYARMLRIPLVMSYHTHLPAYGKNYLGFIPGIEEFSWWLLRWAHTRADLTLVTSPQMKEECVANGIPRVDVWRKGIDTVRFHPKFRSDEWRNKMTDGNPDDFTMVNVGRLGGEKRIKDIRAMMEKMPENTRLCIVGKGPQEDELKKYFKGTNTIFTGQLGGDDLSAVFASADAFVMPSDSETLGFVVLESMASGVPVVGANAGGIPSIIDDGDTGHLAEVGDVDDFVAQLNRLRDTDYRRRMGERARREAERWGWEAATSVLRNVQYERAIANFHSRGFSGYGRPGTRGALRLMGYRAKRILGRLRVPGFRNGRDRSVASI